MARRIGFERHGCDRGCSICTTHTFTLPYLELILSTSQNHPDDLTHTVFWLYNCTVWLHLMRCDQNINETCELLGSFDVIEEVINTVYGELVSLL